MAPLGLSDAPSDEAGQSISEFLTLQGPLRRKVTNVDTWSLTRTPYAAGQPATGFKAQTVEWSSAESYSPERKNSASLDTQWVAPYHHRRRDDNRTRQSNFSWDRHQPRQSPFVVDLLLIPLLIVIAGAWIYRWVDEDALINFRIIDNLLAGHGPVFNVGERVEAYTSPLWLFTLAGLHVVIPFVTLEWLSVGVGIFTTAVGVVLGGRGVQRLGASRHEYPVLPLGLLIFASVAATWEFATSGLEMGMAFGWIGLCFWTLVRTENQRKSATLCAFCIGLGPLVRPELVFMSVIFLVGLGVVVAAPNWKGPVAVGRRFVLPLIIALALPVLYELGVWPTLDCLSPTRRLRSLGRRHGGHKDSPTCGISWSVRAVDSTHVRCHVGGVASSPLVEAPRPSWCDRLDHSDRGRVGRRSLRGSSRR